MDLPNFNFPLNQTQSTEDPPTLNPFGGSTRVQRTPERQESLYPVRKSGTTTSRSGITLAYPPELYAQTATDILIIGYHKASQEGDINFNEVD